MADADQVLMKRFQDGDHSAFEVLVHKYQGLVLSLARRYLGSRYAGIEDVAQQVFIRVFKGRMTYRPRAKVKTWLYSIAVNACLNEIRHLRAEKIRRVSSFTAVFGDKTGEEGRPELDDERSEMPSGGMEGDDVSSRVRAAVDLLPEQQRLALVLSRFHHCSYEEVSEAMDTTVPAVKSLLTRARENLRNALRDLVDPDSEACEKESAAADQDGNS